MTLTASSNHQTNVSVSDSHSDTVTLSVTLAASGTVRGTQQGQSQGMVSDEGANDNSTIKASRNNSLVVSCHIPDAFAVNHVPEHHLGTKPTSIVSNEASQIHHFACACGAPRYMRAHQACAASVLPLKLTCARIQSSWKPRAFIGCHDAAAPHCAWQ